MPRYLMGLLVCVCLSVHIPLTAQQPVMLRPDSLPRAITVPKADSLLQHAAIDRYNQAKSIIDASVAGGMVRTIGETDFRQYVKKELGEDRLKQLGRFSAPIDSLQVEQYFLKKAGEMRKHFQGLLSPESYLRFGPPQHKLQGLSASMVNEDVPGLPLQSRVLLQGADRITLGSIPLDIAYSNLFSLNGREKDYLSSGVFKLSFSREAYLEKLNAKLQAFYDLKKFFLNEMDLETAMHTFTEQRLHGIRTSIDSLYGKGLGDVLPKDLNVDQLVQLDSAQIKRLFAIDDMELPALATDSLANLQRLRQKANRMAVSKVLSLKKELESGVPAKEQLARFDGVKTQLSQWINTDDSRIRNAKELFPLTGLQRLFLRVKDLNIGSFNPEASASSISGLFMNGAAASFLDKGKMLMLGAGTRTDGLGMKDAFLTDNVAASRYAMQFARLGKGAMEEDHSHVTVLNANTKNNDQQQISQQFLKRNIFVGTYSQQLRLGEYGTLNGEFSKSNSSFGEVTAGNNGYTVSEKSAAMNFLSDFWQTASIGLNYSGDVKEWTLSQRAYVDYAGMGYNNPGTPFGARGAWKYGLDVRKRWKFHRMVTGLRADFRDTRTGEDAGWKNRQLAADIQFRVKRNWTFSSRLMQSSMNSTGGVNASGFFTRQFSLTSQHSGMIGFMPANNLVITGLQQMRVTNGSEVLNSLLLNVNIAENIVIDRNLLSINFLYNRDVKQNALYSNLLTMDAGWGYVLAKKIRCNSALAFLDNKGVVTQLGIKQGLSCELLPGLNASVYADCRKSFYNSAQNYLFGNFRSEFSLQYIID